MLFKTAVLLAMPLTIMGDELKLKASFTGLSGPITGKVTLKRRGDTLTKGKWKVTFDHVDVDEIEDNIIGCAGFKANGKELNWHVHDSSAGENESDCGGTVTGGHYDPTFACSGASEYKGTTCEYLKASTREEYVYTDECSKKSQGKCEIGDQSGKMGPVVAKTNFKKSFADDWIGDIADLEGKALVFHCCTPDGCGTRVACANLVAD
jgi:hypothetical protein